MFGEKRFRAVKDGTHFGLPPGFILDEATGDITGAAVVAGEYAIKVEALAVLAVAAAGLQPEPIETHTMADFKMVVSPGLHSLQLPSLHSIGSGYPKHRHSSRYLGDLHIF